MPVQLVFFITQQNSFCEQLPAPWVQHSRIAQGGKESDSPNGSGTAGTALQTWAQVPGHGHTQSLSHWNKELFPLFKFNKCSWLQCSLLLGHKPWFCSRAAGTPWLNGQSTPGAALQRYLRLFNGNKGNNFLHSRVCRQGDDQWLNWRISEVFSSLNDCVILLSEWKHYSRYASTMLQSPEHPTWVPGWSTWNKNQHL